MNEKILIFKILEAVEGTNPYEEYINNPEWAEMTNYLIDIRGMKCEGCGIWTPDLHLHHITYERLFNELSEDLILLCNKCYAKELLP